jgi:hypothetical protein
MAIVVHERDKTFSLKRLSPYDLQAVVYALWEGTDSRKGEGFGDRLAELAQLCEEAQEGVKYGEHVFKERDK